MATERVVLSTTRSHEQGAGTIPTSAEGLKKGSRMPAIRRAIGRTIAQLEAEGREREQAIAIAYSQAREATGKALAHHDALEPYVEGSEPETKVAEQIEQVEEQIQEAESPKERAELIERLEKLESRLSELETHKHESEPVAVTAVEVAQVERVEPDYPIEPQPKPMHQKLPRWLW